MLTRGPLLEWAMLVAGALLLSVMQAWAFAPDASRWPRHLIAWGVSSLGLVVPFLIVLGSPGFAREEVQTILFLTAVAAAISLGIGAWFGRKLEAGQTTVRQRAFALFWPHMVMLAVLGGIAIFFLYAAALSRIH